MSDRETLIAHIREAIAEDPDTLAISVSPDIKALIGLDWIDGVQVLGDEAYAMTTSGTIH
jgi:hypothetical protein